MESRSAFLHFCSKIAADMAEAGFKPLPKGQRLKKVSDNKDIFFEIYFQSSTLNDSSYIKVLPHISVYSKNLKPWSAAQTRNPHETGLIYANQIGYVTPLKTWKEWNVAGEGESHAASEITALLKMHVLPIFNIFNDTASAIQFLKSNGTRFNPWTEPSLSPLNFMICFGQKSDAELFFNDFVNSCRYKKRIVQLYCELSQTEVINLNHSEFADANKVKLAFVNGLQLLS